MNLLGEIDGATVDVVVTPECWLDGYVSTEDRVTRQTIGQYALDPESSPYVRGVADWAAANGSWFVLGCTRLDSAGGSRNSAVILDRAGGMAGYYDKIHCQTHDTKYTPGDRLPVFQTDIGTLGIMICADRRWPETVRTLALKGASLILNPTYGMHDERNLRMMQTRSYESEVFIAFTHPRQSLITGPRGEVVINVRSPGSGVSITKLDLAEVAEVRSGESAHLRDRRPDLYL
jgi:predicted amidohydrolase